MRLPRRPALRGTPRNDYFLKPFPIANKGNLLEREIRVLVAEADPSFVKIIADSMEESGSLYDLESVSSGRIAWKNSGTKIRHSPPGP